MKNIKTTLLSLLITAIIGLCSDLCSAQTQETAYANQSNSGLASSNGEGHVSETFIGNYAGESMTYNPSDLTFHNTFIGAYAGKLNTTGKNNTFVGSHTGDNIIAGDYNVFLGSFSGHKNEQSRNTFLGYASGSTNNGIGNVFIGHAAGQLESGDNKLYIANSTSTPLIYGSFATNKIGIGTTNLPGSIGGVNISNYKLFVPGGILTEQLRVRTGWADYVFDASYSLQPLSQVETYIKENGHLPNVPSAEEVEKQGIEIGEMTKIQQEKIEELTLYIIEQEKRIEKLEAIINKK